MQRIFQRTSPFILAGVLSMLSGCGDGVDATTVLGRVTYRGEPLANGSVMFHPDKGQPVSVGIDAAGLYSAELSPGEYRVAVNAEGIQVPEGWKEGDPDPPPPKLILPPQYSQRARTVLQLIVVEGSDPQTKDFALK